jgi:hypothetical protein
VAGSSSSVRVSLPSPALVLWLPLGRCAPSWTDEYPGHSHVRVNRACGTWALGEFLLPLK